MRLVDPFKQPARFAEQVNALFQAGAARPGGTDPIAAIDAHLEASFEAVLRGVSTEPEPLESPAGHAAASGQAGQATSQRAAMTVAAAQIGMATAPAAGMPWGVGALGGAYLPPAASTVAPFQPALAPFAYQAPPLAAVDAARPGGAAGMTHFEPLIAEMSTKYAVPEWLVYNVVKAESAGNPGATSPVGAMGLMQLMPGTARDLGVSDPYDPRQNVEGGVKYLRQLMDMFGGDLTKAVAAYNAGPGNVQRYGGVPPFDETQHYVKRVLG